MSISPRRAAFALAIFSAVPLLAACPEKKPAPFDAGLPPPTPVIEAGPLQEMPSDTLDAGDDAADAGKKYAGPAVNTNVARLKQCCNALASTAKGMGSSPEGAMFVTAAAQCSAMAAQAGPTGTAPELGPIRALLAGKTLPAACAGL
jgi:hypothetical protein